MGQKEPPEEKMDPKENTLRAIAYDSPAYVPYPGEEVRFDMQFDGNMRTSDWTDSWGVGWQATLKEYVPFPKANPLPSLERLSEFRFPDPGALIIGEAMSSTLGRRDRGRFILTGQLTYLLFERAWALMGMEECLMAFHTHPREMHELLHRIADYDIAVFSRYLELGVDAIGFSEDLGSQKALMMSPQTFREFILPEYQRIFSPALAAGKMVFFHSCGCVQDIVPDLANIGVTMLNPVQARANDLQRVKADASAGRLALHGAVDSHLLVVGTPESVRQETLRVMGILAPGGGYVLGPDQGLLWPEANYRALVETARTYGHYPLDLPPA
jgi:uroporphyrinogen decarboxylase